MARPAPDDTGRTVVARLPWLGALLGLLLAWGWSDGSALWLAFGACVGIASELGAARIAARETAPTAGLIAFFLSFQTLLGLIPFVLVAGFVSQPVPIATPDPRSLLLLPVGAALVTALRRVRSGPAREDERPPALGEAEDPSRWSWIFGALTAVILLAYADAHVPAPYSIDFLYLLPVVVVTRVTGTWGGFLLAGFSAEARGIARGLSHPGEVIPALTTLESLVMLAGLVCVVLFLTRIQEGLARETVAARTDSLTGLVNRKAFLEQLETEISRAGRHQRPFSVAYLDLDGFKPVNDLHGHAAGDEVLKAVAGVLRGSLRAEDLPARFGGDEFAILLPETGPDIAPRVVERLRAEIEDRMLSDAWPVTCSVGVVTTTGASASVDELLQIADQLMYEVKHEGKNALRQVVVSLGHPPEDPSVWRSAPLPELRP